MSALLRKRPNCQRQRNDVMGQKATLGRADSAKCQIRSWTLWPVHNISPKLPQTIDATGGRAPQGRVTHKQIPGKCFRPRLEQRIECCASIAGEGMGWCCQVDLLPNEDIQFGDGALEAFELRQVRCED
jgi:hypothetical protein